MFPYRWKIKSPVPSTGWNWTLCTFITYATHCQHDYKVTGGLEWAKKVCVSCFCMFSVSLQWTGLPLMIYGFCSGKIWRRPCSAIPACYGNIPLHHKLPFHSVKVFFTPSENVLFGNLLHKGYWGPVTVFWQGLQHFSHIVLVVIEDEYTHPLLETAIISTRFLFIVIFVTVGSGVIVLKWSFLFLWPDCRW